MYSMDFKLENPTGEEQEKVNNMKQGVKLYITIFKDKPEIKTTIQKREVKNEMGHAKLILRCDNGEISILHDGNVVIRGLVINNGAQKLDDVISLDKLTVIPPERKGLVITNGEQDLHDVISLDKITVIPPERGGGRKSKRRRYRSTKRKRSRRYK